MTCGSRLARNGIDVPVAADESIRKAEDPLRVRDLEAADVVVVKVAPLGGVRAALRGRRGLRAARGRLVGARHERRHRGREWRWRRRCPGSEHACGLGTVALLDGDVAAAPLVPVGGALPVGPGGGRPGAARPARRAAASGSPGGATGSTACAELLREDAR